MTKFLWRVYLYLLKKVGLHRLWYPSPQRTVNARHHLSYFMLVSPVLTGWTKYSSCPGNATYVSGSTKLTYPNASVSCLLGEEILFQGSSLLVQLHSDVETQIRGFPVSSTPHSEVPEEVLFLVESSVCIAQHTMEWNQKYPDWVMVPVGQKLCSSLVKCCKGDLTNWVVKNDKYASRI